MILYEFHEEKLEIALFCDKYRFEKCIIITKQISCWWNEKII